MAIYNVIMRQGITVANLTGDTLVTGSGNIANDKVQSCSAVLMMNTGNLRAGLFHFPAGNINDDVTSQTVLNNMATYVAPDWAFIAWGGAGLGDSDMIGHQEKQEGAWQTEQLRSYVLRLMPLNCRLSRKRAVSGVVWLRANNGNPDPGFGEPNGTVTDLRTVGAGAYQNYTIYW